MPWDGPTMPPLRLPPTPVATHTLSGQPTQSRLRAPLLRLSSRAGTPQTAPPPRAVWHTARTSPRGTRSPSRWDGTTRAHPRPLLTPAVTPSLSEYPTQWRAPRPRLSRRTTTRTVTPPPAVWHSPRTSSRGTRSPSRWDGTARARPRRPLTPAVTPSLSEYSTQHPSALQPRSGIITTLTVAKPSAVWH